MVESRRSSSAGRWPLAFALGLGSGCAVGDGTGDPGPWTQPIPAEQDGDIDFDPKGGVGSTTDEMPGASTMNPPPEPGASEDESGAPPMEEGTTTDAGPFVPGTDESTGHGDDDDEPQPLPPGDPLWAPCNEDADCDSGVCFFVIDGETQQPKSAYCSQSCAIPAADCPAPNTGNATPACLASDEGVSLCGLDCSYGQACPFGMECIPITAVARYCF